MRAEDDVVLDRETDVVSSIRLSIADSIGSNRYELWLAETELVFSGNVLQICSSKQFQLEWIRNNFSAEIRSACKDTIKADVDLQFCFQEQSAGSAQPASASQNITSTGLSGGVTRPSGSGEPLDPSGRQLSTVKQPGTQGQADTQQAGAHSNEAGRKPLSGKRRFASLSTFVVGPSNQLALTSAQMVSRQPGSISPLFVYGPSGVGKSHLLEGLWGSIRSQRDRRRRCIYLTAEQFTSYFLESLHGRGLPNFRRRYRGLDLLIIEDVQFFAGKQATISELLHTVDSLTRDGRQVAFSADRPPNELTQLGSELTNRLVGGLVVNMQPPDEDTRLKILRSLAKRRSIEVPDEVLNMIATRLQDDVRKLHGAMNRLVATSLALQQPITTDLARNALEEVFRSSSRHVQLSDIERIVCDTFGVEPNTLRSNARTRAVSQPRMLAMWLARKYTRAGLAEIGEFFGRRSHSTVVSAEKKVNSWRSQGQVLRMVAGDFNAEDAIRQIESRLHAG